MGLIHKPPVGADDGSSIGPTFIDAHSHIRHLENEIVMGVNSWDQEEKWGKMRLGPKLKMGVHNSFHASEELPREVRIE